MPDAVGPKTLEHIKNIKENLDSRIEELGRKLGIPEDRPMLLTLVEMEKVERLAERIDAFQAEAQRWHKEQEDDRKHRFNVVTFLRDTCSSIIGNLDAHYPQKKK